MNVHDRLKEPQLFEPIGAPSLSCNGFGPIVIHDGEVHLILWQSAIEPDGNMVRHVIGRLVLRLDRVRPLIGMLNRAVGALGLN